MYVLRAQFMLGSLKLGLGSLKLGLGLMFFALQKSSSAAGHFSISKTPDLQKLAGVGEHRTGLYTQNMILYKSYIIYPYIT